MQNKCSTIELQSLSLTSKQSAIYVRQDFFSYPYLVYALFMINRFASLVSVIVVQPKQLTAVWHFGALELRELRAVNFPS